MPALPLLNRSVIEQHQREAIAAALERSTPGSERRILAALDHPHIARLLDGGTSEEGVPYLVLEYIEGEPINRYCDARGLGIRRRS